MLFASQPIIATTIFHQAKNTTIKKLPFYFEASILKPKNFLWAKVYVRKYSIPVYFPIPMQGSGNRFYVEIPENFTGDENGFFYYIEVTTTDQRKTFFPKGGINKPIHINVQGENTFINISFLSPKKESAVSVEKSKLTAIVGGLSYLGFNEQIKVLLNNQIVNFRRNGNFLEYEPDKNQLEEKNQYKIQVFSKNNILISEAKLPFFFLENQDPHEKIENLSKNKKKSEKFKTTGSVNLTYQFAKTYSEEVTPIPNPSGFYSFQGQLKSQSEESHIFIGPFTLTSQETEPGNRNSQFILGYKNGPLTTQWGNISSSLDGLSGSGVSVLGGEASYSFSEAKSSQLKIKVFGGETKMAVEQVDDPNLLGVFGRYSYGNQLYFSILNKKIVLIPQYILMKDNKESIRTHGFIPAIENQAFSLKSSFQLSKNFFLEKIDVDYGFTSNNNEVIDVVTQEIIKEKKNGQGISFNILGGLSSLASTFQAKISWLDPDFYAAAGGSGSDSFNVTSSLSQNFLSNMITLQEQYAFNKDNLKRQKDFTTISQTGAITISLKMKKLPTLIIADNIQTQKSDDATNPAQQLNNSLNFSSQYTLRILSQDINLNFGFSQSDSIDYTIIEYNAHQITRSYTNALSANKIFKSVVVSYTGSYSLNESISPSKDLVNRTLSHAIQNTINFSISFLKKTITIPLSLNHAKNFSNNSEQKTNTDTIGVSSQIQWKVSAKQNLSLNTSLNFFNNRENLNANYRQFSFTGTYSATL